MCKIRFQVISEGCRDRKVQSKGGPSTSFTEYAALKSKLTYPEFLDALVVLGERMFRKTVPGGSRSKPKGGHCKRSVESTFQQVRGDL